MIASGAAGCQGEGPLIESPWMVRSRIAPAWVVLLVMLGVAPPAGSVTSPPKVPPSGPVAEAWVLFRGFHEDLARIDRARAILEQSVEREPSLEALILLAWVHLTWADHRAPTSDNKLAAYARGRDTARRAIDLAPRNPDAHLWYAANLGRWAVTRGKLRAAFLLSDLQKAIDTVLQLDPDHVGGLALAGSFYLETPGLLGGDLARAEAYERKALALDPHFTRARVELARCLIARGRFAEARRELQQVVDETEPSYLAEWVVRHKPTARRLLGEIRDKS
jgi:tetratricopeptide (TPR) repeat protein